MLTEWTILFINVPSFQVLLKEFIYPALRPLLKGLREDFIALVTKSGLTSAASITSRIIRVARCFIIHYLVPPGLLLDEFELMIAFLVHTFQPDLNCGTASANIDRLLAPSVSPNRNHANDQFGGYSLSLLPASFNNGINNMNAMANLPNSAGVLMSRLNIPVQGMAANLNKVISTLQTSVSNSNQGQTQAGGNSLANLDAFVGNSLLGMSLITQNVNDSKESGTDTSFIPSHPAGCCLEGDIIYNIYSSFLFTTTLFSFE